MDEFTRRRAKLSKKFNLYLYKITVIMSYFSALFACVYIIFFEETDIFSKVYGVTFVLVIIFSINKIIHMIQDSGVIKVSKKI